MKRIFWAGDSTVKDNYIDTYPRTGIAQGLRLYVKPDVVILNHAENARSTKNFIAEGRLDRIKNEIQENDFLFIEFGHNDWNEDPNRHTQPFGDYQRNLLQMIDVARSKKAYPVLITPLYCRFLDERQSLKENVHFDYPAAMIALAFEQNVPYIDLCKKSETLLLKTDLEVSKGWFMNLTKGRYVAYPDGIKDDAHLQHEGAVVFAKLIADGLKELGSIYAELIR
ncbi:rhamnogalacturonan acetylesterase [Candidatus Galacturonibacter soehngenii]|uniref:Rhamnogalacturonan acetylesterase n=1 Tax=Candidatus Galacturonatibacter soehngenii TaxID=2307010 RepID=A0A7V7QMU5_9FIRM|nr:rhamnogalacturonan acetylesterase [Candidatus Galacturonibacter soehngenii]KAB1440082.1 rhamnogalacturonan acetylesterase [Candidatus Galacturonibacter soehngenii]MBA4686090.1 rhamnogalacturonan acetylesterase [Candidatus Galacturonibacter soehngenii]